MSTNLTLHFCVKHSVKHWGLKQPFSESFAEFQRGDRSSRFVECKLRKSSNRLIYKRKNETLTLFSYVFNNQ